MPRRGLLAAGGFPVEMPDLSVDESCTKPTWMLYRNVLAVEIEEMIHSHPLDGVVLMATGCSTNAASASSPWRDAQGWILPLDDLDALGRVRLLIANVRPAGRDDLMEDFS